ncbi:MAG: DNA-directed RNA polymerase subunit alpha, partial [Patescibacteria group bacterium]
MKISLPKHPRIEHKKGNEATIVVEDLYPGYGLTLGNALRRILLASLPGTAIVSAKIKGMDHEFSTLPNVAEDGVELALNLKQVRLKLHGEEPQTLTISVKGEKEVTAKDIKAPSQVEIMNPEIHIATLTDKKAELEIELQVERGLGYISVENRKSKKLDIGTVAFDAIFTPVRKVSYEVQDMRFADRTDYNRLLISMETDGSITPEEAFR